MTVVNIIISVSDHKLERSEIVPQEIFIGRDFKTFLPASSYLLGEGMSEATALRTKNRTGKRLRPFACSNGHADINSVSN
jgi:hypothetical protein